ncbi:hypothetical protein GQ602_005631 [Ophiocordyceps camponoti-floridani]|uniref:Uncharacterized protein n=1 Tax=Ophiocordyceps camponoti-floridani TaxID=2030778 RepID=A0A8H4Q3P3_9HYPO|nr:hypothetical protein GQ602_005631 [Ophiocordyceps camponoti-floridani]
MEQDAIPRQPDFPLAANSLRSVADQLERCGNLPAVDGGDRLVQRLDAVLEQLAMLNHKVDGLDRKVTVSNRNAVVRARNGTVVRGDMDLVPLHSVLTGEVIERFPSNVDQLERLHARDVDQLLRHIGESVVGSAAEKKRSLKFACGLVTREL